MKVSESEYETRNRTDSQAMLWAHVDFFAGAIVGFYVPTVASARNSDCFSSSLSTFLSLASYYKYFDS